MHSCPGVDLRSHPVRATLTGTTARRSDARRGCRVVREALPRTIRLVLGGGLAFFVFGCNSALGATFTDSCATALDPQTCERTEYVANATDTIIQLLGWSVGVLLFVAVVGVFWRTFGGESR